eukprot:COSAG02_NODE_3993_length_5942_cov_2.729249_4_plen_69_part_00
MICFMCCCTSAGKSTIATAARDWIDTHNELPIDIEYATALLFQLELTDPDSTERAKIQKQLDGFPRLS